MESPMTSQGPGSKLPTCETNEPPKSITARNATPAGLAPADRENMLSVFPEMAERIIAAARSEVLQKLEPDMA